MALTEQGWEWAEANMGGAFAQTPEAARTLSAVLSAVNQFLRQEGLGVEEVFGRRDGERRGTSFVLSRVSESADLPFPFPVSTQEVPDFEDSPEFTAEVPAPMLEASLLRHLATLSLGDPETSLSLSEFRKGIEMERDQVDEALLRLHQEGKVELTMPSDLRDLSESDRESAVVSEQGVPYHLVRLAGEFHLMH
ncbi:MAG: hypothetical protein AAF191_20095 [Verrucomicrobiota bacterium]